MSADIPDVEDKSNGAVAQQQTANQQQLNQMRERILSDMAKPLQKTQTQPLASSTFNKEEEQKVQENISQKTDTKIKQMGKQQSNDNTRIHIIQDEHQSKVLQTGIVKKRQGIMFKSYKEYEMFLLQNGMILFYNTDTSKKDYQQEKKALRLQIDETMFIESHGTPKLNKKDTQRSRSKSNKRSSLTDSEMGSFIEADQEVERFSVKLGNTQSYFESPKADQWPDAFKNFVWN